MSRELRIRRDVSNSVAADLVVEFERLRLESANVERWVKLDPDRCACRKYAMLLNGYLVTVRRIIDGEGK